MPPRCTKHPEKDMVRVFQGTELVGVGFDRHQAYFEDYLCEVCKFRVRLHYTVIDVGREVKKDGG